MKIRNAALMTVVIAVAITGPVAAETLTACVTMHGRMTLIGPTFKRQVCRRTETLLTFNTEGPQGPQGPTGAEGIPGPAGSDGLDAEVLHVFDANGQNLGLLTSALGETRMTYVPTLDAIVRVEANTLYVGEIQTVYFTGANCTGTPMVRGLSSSQAVVSSAGVPQPPNTRFFKLTGALITASQQSRIIGNTCQSDINIPSEWAELIEITLPYTLPLARPITVDFAP